MTTIDDIKTYPVHYIWKDDAERRIHSGLVAETTVDVMAYLLAQVDYEKDEWVKFDEQVLYYIEEGLGETIESLYNFDNQNVDFLLVESPE